MMLPYLLLGNLGGAPPWLLYPQPGAEGSWASVVAIVVAMLLVPLVCAVRGFLRLRTLSKRAKVGILGGCATVAAASALIFGPDVGFYVALGLTLQVTAALNWSERCYALLGGRAWQRIATAVSGVVVAFGLFGAAVLFQQLVVYLDHAYMAGWLGLKAFLMQALHELAPFLTVYVVMVIVAVIQHMRAYYRARDWELARETGEPPESVDLPTEADGNGVERDDNQG